MGYTIAQIVLSALGTVDAGLLWGLDNKKLPDLPCSSNGGCVIVANSIYSQVHLFGKPIDVATIGSIGYVALLSLAMAKAASETSKSVNLISMAMVLITGGAVLYSFYLQYVSFVIIGHHCDYCIVSACIMTTLFIISALERRALSRTSPMLAQSSKA